MKILHLISSTGYHGAENMLAELIRQLDAIGVDNYLGVFDSNSRSNIQILDEVTQNIRKGVVFPCKGRIDFSMVKLIRNYVTDNDIHVLHSHKYKTNLYALLAARKLSCGLVSTCHNWIGTSLSMRSYEWLDKKILRFFDYAVGVSGEVSSILIANIGEKKTKYIGNGVDCNVFRPHNPDENKKAGLGDKNKTRIGFVGRLSPEKGLDSLLEALVLVRKKGLDTSVVLVGDGDYKAKLAERASNLGISNYVSFMGQQNNIQDLYSIFDVFVLPSVVEAFPMVILEAMASGIPVVSTPVGDVPKIVTSGKTGLIVPPGNPVELAEAIMLMLGDKKLSTRLSVTARETVCRKHSSRAMAEQYKDVYKAALIN